jgi:chemotaxis protein methyltransferase CheR
VRILATDIDSQVLAHASAGVYGEDRFEKMTPARRVRWFETSRNGRDHIVKPDLKQLISFKPLNLIETWPMKGPFDVIFCRNVVIYFKRSTQAALFANMAQLQRPGDHLFIGHSESLFNVSNDYELAGQTIYVRGE